VQEPVVSSAGLNNSDPAPHDAQALGFGIVATRGTAAALEEAGVHAETVLKIQEGRPNAADLMKARRPCAAGRPAARSWQLGLQGHTRLQHD